MLGYSGLYFSWAGFFNVTNCEPKLIKDAFFKEINMWISKENDCLATLREKIFQFLPPFLLDVPSSKVPSVDSISVHNTVQGKAHQLPNIPNPEKNIRWYKWTRDYK